MKIKIYFIFCGLVAFVLFGPTVLPACPGCNSLSNALGRAFNPSVLFMMAMPFLVFSAIAAGLLYSYRRAQENTNTDPNNSANPNTKA